MVPGFFQTAIVWKSILSRGLSSNFKSEKKG